MKKNLKKTAIVAVIAAALAIQGASAQVVVANGDLIFGAENISNSTASGSNLEVDLGNISSFTQTSHFSLGNVTASDLTSALGSSSYATSSTSFWSVVGTNPVSATSDLSVGGVTQYQKAIFVTISPDIGAQKGSQLTTPSSDIVGVYNSLTAAGVTATGDSNGKGAIIPITGSSYSNSEGTAAAGTNFFELSGTGPTSFGGGGTLDLYALSPFGDYVSKTETNQTQLGTDTLLGSFSYSSAGGLTFTGVDVVPEPSSYALMLAGAAVLLWQLKRRKRVNS